MPRLCKIGTKAVRKPTILSIMVVWPPIMSLEMFRDAHNIVINATTSSQSCKNAVQTNKYQNTYSLWQFAAAAVAIATLHACNCCNPKECYVSFQHVYIRIQPKSYQQARDSSHRHVLVKM